MLKKIIIVEGVDLSGKSTLINKVKDMFRDSVIVKQNFRPKDKESSDEHFNRLKHLFDTLKNLPYEYLIFDRFHLSELVYSKIRGYEADHNIAKEIENMLSSFDTVILSLNISSNELTERFNRIGDEHIKDDHLLININNYYDEILDNSSLKVIRLNQDYNEEGLKKCIAV